MYALGGMKWPLTSVLVRGHSVTSVGSGDQSRGSSARAVHFAAPGPGLTPAAGLDELLEAAHIALDTPIKDTQPVGHVLDEPFGVDVHLGSDPSGGVVEAVEGDDPGVIRAVVRVPRDALVGSLLGDGGVELPGHSGDAGHPVSVDSVMVLMCYLP